MENEDRTDQVEAHDPGQGEVSSTPVHDDPAEAAATAGEAGHDHARAAEDSLEKGTEARRTAAHPSGD